VSEEFMIIVAAGWILFVIGLFIVTAMFINSENRKGGD
jgi:hypothetical protein